VGKNNIMRDVKSKTRGAFGLYLGSI